MSVPPKRRPRSSIRTRASHFALKEVKLNKCSKCGSAVEPHRACSVCGYYKDKEVVKIKTKTKTAKAK